MKATAPAPRRIRNYFYAHNRVEVDDDLPWLRIPGLDKLNLARPVVLINGAFDLLTPSHMRLIAIAREKAGVGGTVLCALDSDAKVTAAKGPARPIMTFAERATALAYMPIDYLVEIESDADMRRLVSLLKPDMRVLGGEYRNAATRFPGVPRYLVADRGLHTSVVIERIINRHART